MSRTEIKDKGSGSKDSPKSEWFGYKYKVTPETSKLLQEAAFKDGGTWAGKQDFKSCCTHIFITGNGNMTYLDDGDDEYFKEESNLPEKDPPQPVNSTKQFKEGYWYKCADPSGGTRLGRYYQLKIKKSGDIGVFKNGENVDIGEYYYTRFDVNSESTFNPIVNVSVNNGIESAEIQVTVKESFYTAYVTFPNSYNYKEYAYKISKKHYDIVKDTDAVILRVDVNGTIKNVNLVRLSNALDPKATKEIRGVASIEGFPFVDIELNIRREESEVGKYPLLGETGMNSSPLLNIYNDWQSKQINLNQQEETQMSNSNRRVVNVKLLDNDSGLPVENSLVAQFDNIVTEDSNDVVVQEILLNKNIADSIAKHNQKRVEQTDLEILKRTGNDVKLRQVKLKDLTWIVTTA